MMEKDCRWFEGNSLRIKEAISRSSRISKLREIIKNKNEKQKKLKLIH